MLPILLGIASAVGTVYSWWSTENNNAQINSNLGDIQGDIRNIHGDLVKQGQVLSQQSVMLSSIQSSIGALGMLSAVGCALSAVNVYQLIRVQKKLSNIRLLSKVDF